MVTALHPVLPKTYNSWSQVLIDWGVSRAYLQTEHAPRCFTAQPELAAAFVAEVGAIILAKQLQHRATEVAIACQSVTEPTHDRVGGTPYLEQRTVMEAAQDRYLAAYRDDRTTENDSIMLSLQTLRSIMEQHQDRYYSLRRQHEPEVRKNRQQCAHKYWSVRPVRGIPDTFFADVLPHSAVARMQRIHPPWWGMFLGRLQKILIYGHPAEGYLLDELPRLRGKATKKTLEAVITEWQEKNADRWGWYEQTHYLMLALRAAKKATQLTCWFNACAPGYLSSETMQATMRTDLAEHLAAHDPWALPVHDSRTSWCWGEHGLN